jgi:hypothetical protein
MASDTSSTPSPRHDSEKSSETKNTDRSAAKTSWMLVYDSTSPSITREMLDEYGFSPTECHTLISEGHKYTYFRLCRRVREKQIVAFMENSNKVHNVQYDDKSDPDFKTVISDGKKDSKLTTHPVFRHIRTLTSTVGVVSDDHGIETWTESKSEVIHLRLMKRFNEASDRALLKRYSTAESELAAAKEKIKDLKKQNLDLRASVKKSSQNNQTKK